MKGNIVYLCLLKKKKDADAGVCHCSHYVVNMHHFSICSPLQTFLRLEQPLAYRAHNAAAKALNEVEN